MRFVPAGQILFEVDSVGKEFYIILKGKCSFYFKCKNSEKSLAKEKAKKLEEIPLIPIDTSQLRKKSSYGDVPKAAKIMRTTVENRGNEYHAYHMGLLMSKINTMGIGDTFGELALISENENELRKATVLCTEDCEFAVLDRRSFQVAGL